MSAAIKKWQERIKDGGFMPSGQSGDVVMVLTGASAQMAARDAEIADLRAALRAPVQAQGVALSERDAFEAYSPTMHLTRNQHGAYENLYVDAAWNAWQGRAALDQAQQSEDARDALESALDAINRSERMFSRAYSQQERMAQHLDVISKVRAAIAALTGRNDAPA